MTWDCEDLMIVAGSRLLQNHSVVFAGVGAPLLASALAHRLHCPDLTIVLEGGFIGPRMVPGKLPISTNEMRAAHRSVMLTGIIDVGGLGPADPALDLVVAWHLLDPGPRQVLRDDLGCDWLEWERGKAWAFEQAMGLVWYYVESNPAMSRMGRRTLHRLVADACSLES